MAITISFGTAEGFLSELQDPHLMIRNRRCYKNESACDSTVTYVVIDRHNDTVLRYESKKGEDKELEAKIELNIVEADVTTNSRHL